MEQAGGGNAAAAAGVAGLRPPARGSQPARAPDGGAERRLQLRRTRDGRAAGRMPVGPKIDKILEKSYQNFINFQKFLQISEKIFFRNLI